MAAHRSSPLARRVRLALFAVGAASLAVGVTVFYVLWSGQTLALRLGELERQVGVIASGVSVGTVLPGGAGDGGGVRARLLRVEAGIIGARLAVTDGSGRVLYSTAGAAAAASYPVAALTGESAVDARSGVLEVPGVGRVAVAAVPVAFDGDTPTRFVVGARPLSDMARADTWVLAAIAVSSLVALGLAATLGSWLARRITGPVVRLTAGVRGLAAGEWGRQVPVEGDGEVAELAGAFNDMSTRVADAYRAQQEFVGDVSHELRTPITSIRGFAGAIRDGVVTTPEQVHDAAAIVYDEAGRLADLTTTLLALADIDAGATPIARQRVEVAPLLAAARSRFDARAGEAGLAIEYAHDDGAPLADPERLLQALSTLIDNAIRHAGSRIAVSARAEGGRWVLEVEDDGPGVPESERDRVFGRFTRLDASRSSASGGSGLGLAICRRLVELMDGTTRVDASESLGGARFRIELPSAGTGPA